MMMDLSGLWLPAPADLALSSTVCVSPAGSGQAWQDQQKHLEPQVLEDAREV